LYTAIAAEALAAGHLDQEYSACVSGAVGPDIRIQEFSQARGTVVWKDPIYEALSARTEFSVLLHEHPLHLMGKSLLIEHPETYRRALMLYTTRNKIVHRGELTEGAVTRSLSVNQNDAWVALSCVTEIFRWFGETRIQLPDRRAVDVSMVKWGGAVCADCDEKHSSHLSQTSNRRKLHDVPYLCGLTLHT